MANKEVIYTHKIHVHWFTMNHLMKEAIDFNSKNDHILIVLLAAPWLR